MASAPKNVNCFNACYSTNIQANGANAYRDNSPFSSLSCNDKGNVALSDGDLQKRDMSDINSEKYGIMSDKQLKIKVRSI